MQGNCELHEVAPEASFDEFIILSLSNMMKITVEYLTNCLMLDMDWRNSCATYVICILDYIVVM